MPYIQSKKLKYFFFALLACSLLSAVFYLRAIDNSGQIVATAGTVKSPLNPDTLSVGLVKDRPMLDVLARTQDVTFTPISLSPDMGEIRFDIELTQLGIYSGEKGFGTQVYRLVNDATNAPVFDFKRRGIITLPDPDEKLGISPTGRKKSLHTITRSTVPATGSYTLHASLEQWLLAAPNLELKLIARTGTQEADTRIVVAIFGTIALSIFLLFLCTPPELRTSKVRSGPNRRI